MLYGEAGCTVWGKSEVGKMGPCWREAQQCPWEGVNSTQGLRGAEGKAGSRKDMCG